MSLDIIAFPFHHVSAERRESMRARLRGLLPGRLFCPVRQQVIEASAIDVSHSGLCVEADVHVPVGAPLVLCLEDRFVEFQVIWSAPHDSRRGIKRYGLLATDPEENIEGIFLAAGCLSDRALERRFRASEVRPVRTQPGFRGLYGKERRRPRPAPFPLRGRTSR